MALPLDGATQSDQYVASVELYEQYQEDPDHHQELLLAAISRLESYLSTEQSKGRQLDLTAMYNLCLMRQSRITRHGAPDAELNDLIDHLEQLTLQPKNTVTIKVYGTLADLLEHRFERHGIKCEADLRKAVTWKQLALQETSENDESFWIRAFGAATLQENLYTIDADDIRLETAQEHLHKALRSCRFFANDRERSVILNAMASVSERRYRHQGRHDLGHLTEALLRAREALACCPVSSTASRIGRLSSLGRVLELHHRQTGKFESLQEALKHSTEAVRLLEPGNPRASSWLHNLSMLSLSMYERTRAIEDLGFAIEQAWKALHHTSHTHTLYADRLNGLSVLYSHLFDRSGQLRDIGLSVRFSREALSLAEAKSEHRSSFLNNLASHLTKRFEVKADLVDAAQAIYCEDEALLISQNSASRPAYWVNMSQVLHTVYEKSQARCLLETAVLVLDHALSEIPDHHPLRPKVLSSLAAEYMQLGGYDEPMNHQRRIYWTLALKLLLEAWKSDLADPYQRIQLAYLVSDIYLALGQWSYAGQILVESFKLLPLVTSRALEIGDQQDVISRMTGLIGTLAIIVLETYNDPDRSLEYLEGGRGLIQSGFFQNDADLDRLEAIDDRCARLAGQFRSLQRDLTDPTASLAKGGISLAQTKRQIEQDFQHVLDDVRAVPGFSQFQRSLSINQIKQASAGRIIIVINPTRLGSNAFIVTSNAVLPFTFDSLHFEDGERHIRNFRIRILAAKPNKQNKLFRETLTWLWDSVALPLFQYMRLKPRGGCQRLPKITWICTGVLSNAPIHAAANYASKDVTQRVCEYCLPTFASTIRTISVFQNPASLTKTPVRMMGIEMKTTPGRKRPLERLDEEFANIRNCLPPESSFVHLQQPSAEKVIANLPTAHVVHFSCHGISDAVDPSQSRLLLQRVVKRGVADGASMAAQSAADSGEEEVILDPLTVGQVIRLRLPSAILAVLSACTSAVNENAQLADESLHIAAMMQLAGFRHVIGTLWEAKTDACVDFAAYFYEALFKSGNGVGQVSDERHWTERISEAYHHSLCLLQAKYWMMPLTWAPFVYFG